MLTKWAPLVKSPMPQEEIKIQCKFLIPYGLFLAKLQQKCDILSIIKYDVRAIKLSSEEGFISVFYIFSLKKIVYCFFFLKIFFFAGTLFVMEVTLTSDKYKYTHTV